ncbi:hypothetical protein V8G54_017899 [Vigna mungo]|uniref:Uncharacterized protein n=1 Tax=Vigna mungo TaxID=3915 RepID=A0AAQ3N7M9_VIGMU
MNGHVCKRSVATCYYINMLPRWWTVLHLKGVLTCSTAWHFLGSMDYTHHSPTYIIPYHSFHYHFIIPSTATSITHQCAPTIPKNLPPLQTPSLNHVNKGKASQQFSSSKLLKRFGVLITYHVFSKVNGIKCTCFIPRLNF